MPEINQYAPGEFCWVELATTDDEAARAFYAEVFDWSHEGHAMDHDEGQYYTLRKNGKDVGGLYKMFPEMMKMQVPPNWLSYVSVTDALEACSKAKHLGGSVFTKPMDVMDHGRMAVLSDPTGAAFAVWEPKTHCGSMVRGEPDTPCWTELITKDTEKAGAFYAELFGWELQPQSAGPMPYTMFARDGKPVGGMVEPTPEMGEIPDYWSVYFAVSDCDDFVTRAESQGAQVFAPPFEVPGIGRMAVLGDPQGACFSVIRLA